MPLRVVWLSSVDLLDKSPKKSGTWIHSMYNALLKQTEISVIANFCLSNQKGIRCCKDENFEQYYVQSDFDMDGRLSRFMEDKVLKAIEDLKADIVHIWGTESCWCTLLDRPELQRYKSLLEIQGLKFFWGEKKVIFYGGLDSKEISQMTGLLELLHPVMKIENVRKSFVRWGEVELHMLNIATNINTQSQWVRDLLSLIVPQAHLHSTGIILRDSFLHSDPWYKKHKASGHPVVFTTTSTQSYKGFHVTLKAFKYIVERYPEAELRVAGISIKVPHYRNVGYVNYLRKQVSMYKMEDNVKFLGNLNEKQLVNEMYNADVFVNSSFVESYCLALAEALSLGVPCVASYTTALTELIDDNKTGLFYPIGDERMCASRILSLIKDPTLGEAMSYNSSAKYRNIINPEEIAKNQVSIYKQLS